jgi:signal transduction histidine kinase
VILAERVAQNLTALGFVLLGAATLREWYLHRGRAQAMLAIALVSLAVVAALGPIQTLIGESTFLGIIAVVAFEVCGYFVLRFRDAFLPLSRRALQAATALLVVTCLIGVASVTVLAHADGVVTTVVGLEIILAWSIFTGEPIVRFWLASRNLPSVQKARMRSLSFGFAVLIGILVVAVLGGSAFQSPLAIIITQAIALAIVPVIYVSFAPPGLLRRIWRMGEEAELRSAIQDLLIFSSSRQDLAEKAAGWGRRLLGAQGAFIVDSEGTLIARAGITAGEVDEIMSARKGRPDGGLEYDLPGRGAAIVVPLHLTEGDGHLGVTAGTFTPLFGSDEVNQLKGYASAVTAGLERVKVTERLAAIERNKTQFLNLASHELRGPMTVVRGYVSMLEGGLLGDLNERGQKALPVISTKVMEMNALIEQMIEAARLEDGALMLRPAEIDLRDVVSAAVEAARPLVDQSHVISLQIPERPVQVRADAERIKTIVSNLVSNAIKYSPSGGAIECELTARGGIARVAVKDSGVGIAKEDLSILFTRFGRVSTPHTDHLSGTGLGLYLGRQLARLHGGEITVESSPGKGSTFTLHLPLRSSQPSGPRSSKSAEKASTSR